jgi:hypothetical protein
VSAVATGKSFPIGVGAWAMPFTILKLPR